MEEWLPEVSKGNAIDRDRSISSNIFVDLWLVDRLREGLVPPLCGYFGQEWGHSATGRRKNRNEFEYGGKVDAESMMAVTKRTTRIPSSMRVLIDTPPLEFFAVYEGEPGGSKLWR